MANREHITTAAELDAMTPDERHADFESRVVTDLNMLPADEAERIRAFHIAKLTERGVFRAS